MEEKVYPSPLALHEEVISNGTVFMDTLRKFHSTMGTRFMIPILGGKDLDLHVLYVEVTKRGGFEKVYKEKRLREVIQVFNFPPTTTSAAYVLRKYYNSLLHHYEQVYFFRLQGKLIPSAVPAPVKKSHCERPMPSAIESPPNSMRLNLEQQQQMVWNGGEAFSSLEIRFPILKTPPKKPAMPPPVSVQLPLLALRQQQQLMVCERREGVSTPKLGVPAPVKKSHCKRPMPSAIESPPNSMRLNLEQQQQMVWNGGEAFSSLEIRLPVPVSAPPCKHVMPYVTNSLPNSMQLPLQQKQQHQQQMVRKRGKAFSSPETTDSVHLPLQQQQQHQQQMVCKRGKAFSSPETGVPVPVSAPPCKHAMPYVTNSLPNSMQLPLQQKQQHQQQMVRKRGKAFSSPETTDSVHLPLQQQQQHQQQIVCKRGKAFSSPKTGVPIPFKTPPSKHVMPPPISMQLPLQQQQQQQIECERGEAFPTPETETGAPESFTVKGVIEGEFEDGCFVTVTIGSEIFRGVLYYKSPSETPHTSLPTPNDTIVPVVAPSPNLQHKRKRGKRMRDPNLPKPNRNAYNFFFKEKHSKLKELFPKREREFNKIIGEAWNKLTAEDRMSYQDSALKDKQRYTREMEEYEERMKLMPPKEFTGAGPSS